MNTMCDAAKEERKAACGRKVNVDEDDDEVMMPRTAELHQGARPVCLANPKRKSSLAWNLPIFYDARLGFYDVGVAAFRRGRGPYM